MCPGATVSTRKGVNIGKTRCTMNLGQEQAQGELVITQMLNWAHTNSLEAPLASQFVLMVKNRPANAGDVRKLGSIPGSGRSPGGGNGNPLQYSCLENTTDRRPWWAIVHSAAKSQTRLKRLITKGLGHSLLIFRHSRPLVPLEDWFQELPWTPKSRDVQAPQLIIPVHVSTCMASTNCG